MTHEDPSVRLKRLRYRAHHRGMKEVDLILGPFADGHLGTMGRDELDTFERLLDVADDLIYAWIAGGAQPPADLCDDLMGMIRTIKLSARRAWTS
jgi:antitoxin CptB